MRFVCVVEGTYPTFKSPLDAWHLRVNTRVMMIFHDVVIKNIDQ